MNLYDIVQRVYATTERNPNTQAYYDRVVNFINDYYLNLCSSNRWLFLLTRFQMFVQPDYTVGTVTVSVTSRTVTGLGTGWSASMEGHQFIGPDGKTYTIGAVAAATTLYLSSPYEGATVGGAAYTIRFFGYSMPQDCIEPATLVSREDDHGRIRYIDNDTEATVYLDRDETGDPYLYASAGYSQARTLDRDFTATAGTAPAGTLVSGTKYSYRITVIYEGIEGPPSKEVSFTATATGKIVLSGIQDLRLLGVGVGYKKYLYRRTGATGPYYYMGIITDSTTTYTDDGSVSESIEYPLVEHGQTLRVWFYPRPDSDKYLELWYYKRPKRLDKDGDVPLLPLEFHDLLWRAAAIDILMSFNQPVTALETKLKEQEALLRRRYLTMTDRQWRMGNGWESDLFNLSRVRLGTANMT